MRLQCGSVGFGTVLASSDVETVPEIPLCLLITYTRHCTARRKCIRRGQRQKQRQRQKITTKQKKSRSSSNIGSNKTENKSSDDGSNISWHVIFVINNYFACRHKHKQKGLGGGRRERGREGKEAAQANIGRHWRASSVLHVLVAQMLLPPTLSLFTPPPSFCLA